MLKEIVDETSRGKYDFMYLRIGLPIIAYFLADRLIRSDFANNCKLVSPFPGGPGFSLTDLVWVMRL